MRGVRDPPHSSNRDEREHVIARNLSRTYNSELEDGDNAAQIEGSSERVVRDGFNSRRRSHGGCDVKRGAVRGRRLIVSTPPSHHTQRIVAIWGFGGE